MIRIANEADLPAILKIYAPYVLTSTATFEYTVPTLEEFTHRFREITRQYPWLVWEEGGEILGYAYASAPYTRAAYAWCAEPSIYLRGDVRGRGLGTKLYACLEKILQIQGYHLLYALVTEENGESVAFHEKFLYKKQAYFPECGVKFGRWLGIFWMEKRLKTVEIPTNPPLSWKSIGQKGENLDDILASLSLS